MDFSNDQTWTDLISAIFSIDQTWMDLISAIVGAVLGWFARHFTK